MPPDRYRQAAWIASITERYILSVVYLGFAYAQSVWVLDDWAGLRAGDAANYDYLPNDFILMALNFIMGLVLLIGRPAATTPRHLKEIAVPLAASFYFILFNYVRFLPDALQWLSDNRAPEDWRTPLYYASYVFGALGIAFSTWGIISLGRSFGIFVAVRTVVLRGPYRFVRHPMYCGYIIGSLGLLLADANVALAILVPLQIALFVWRARLEEARLAEFSADYRAYQQRTGFFFPKLRRAVSA
jgi:protein-S-isoprenylcysteine O-methyltransferase Ste14